MKLIYFTKAYPYGMGEQWKKNELEVLKSYFNDITIVPNNYEHNRNSPKQLSKEIKIEAPLFSDIFHVKKWDIVRILFNRNLTIFLKEFFFKKVYLKKQKLGSWLYSTVYVIHLLKHPIIKEIVQKADKNTVLYFFWGKGTAEILPFIKTSLYHKILVRMHRYDLFEYANNNYIPYRSLLMKDDLLTIAPSSQAGKDHLLSIYPNSNNIKVIRLGTKSNDRKCVPSNDGVFRIISCSYLSPVKRVNLMIESLKYVNVPIIWHHIGDGALKDNLLNLAQEMRVTDKFKFLGLMNSDTILDYYSDHKIDLFVNLSESEGVPFSIMEAFSAGIPVMATNVGGTSEIVDDSVGRLLPEDISPEQIANEIYKYYIMEDEEKSQKRINAYNKYLKACNAHTLTKELGDMLISNGYGRFTEII